MTAPRTVRIVIVDDHHMFRTGVRSELTTVAGEGSSSSVRLDVVGEAGAVESATAVDGKIAAVTPRATNAAPARRPLLSRDIDVTVALLGPARTVPRSPPA